MGGWRGHVKGYRRRLTDKTDNAYFFFFKLALLVVCQTPGQPSKKIISFELTGGGEEKKENLEHQLFNRYVIQSTKNK